jgi:selenocysteine-specific elongation factor
LVVAADEGVKPQTKEHLAICSLLAIPSCVVALSKTDLIDEEVLELARLEIEELLSTTRFAGSPIVAVSSTTGNGVESLRAELVEQAANQVVEPDPSEPIRFPIDRAFHLKGLGVVATGTLVSGQVEPGKTLVSLPSGESARVRSMQVHGETRDQAVAGERTAIQLTSIELEKLERGTQLVDKNCFESSTLLAGRFTYLADAPKPLKGWTAIRFHLLSSEVGGKIRPLQGPIEPGAEGFVEIRLAAPVTAVRGDQFVVRRPSPPMTLGGGIILDPAWRRRRASEIGSVLDALDGNRSEVLQLWVEESRERGIDTATLARKLGALPPDVDGELRDLASAQRVLRMEAGRGHSERWIAPSAYRAIAERAKKMLSSYFSQERLSQGMPKAEAVDRILPAGARQLSEGYLGWLQAQGILTVRVDRIDLPGRTAEMTGEESVLSKRILENFNSSSLQPPAPKELCKELGAKPQIFEGVVQYLLERGTLTRLPGGLLIATQALEDLEKDLRSGSEIEFGVGEFKSRFGLTRKWAIPILEHLDSAGVTRRVGDLRQVVGSKK